jgi:hypothetical protein
MRSFIFSDSGVRLLRLFGPGRVGAGVARPWQ